MEPHHMYEYDDNNDVNKFSSAPSSSVHNSRIHPPSFSDEISLFLHQIFYRSSSTTTGAATSSSSMAHMVPQPQEINAHRLGKSSGISAVDFVNTSTGGGASLSGNVMVSGANLSSSSVGVSENDNTDEHDCQSEDIQASVDEVTAKSAHPRSSTKRSRAAEVHNLSEKRRRSRINEKMKALQNLIPNSNNKTDKASMLDEAIEYLKHLQLQVQVLTMGNGLSLYPMCLPGVPPPIQLPQMRMDLGEENGSLHLNSTGTLISQETPKQNVFSLPNQRAYSKQLPLPNMSNIVNSVTSFGLDSSIQANFEPFQYGTYSGETSREDMLLHQQIVMSHSATNSSVPAVLAFNTQGSDLRRDQLEGVHQKTIDHNVIRSPLLTGMQTGRCVLSKDVKPEL